MKTLREGAIAMIDALGIKGIWRGPAGTEDARATKTLRTARGMRTYFVNGLIPTVFQQDFNVEPVVRVLSLSDTMVIAALPRDDVERADLRWPLVDLVCQMASYVMRKVAQARLPLVRSTSVATKQLDPANGRPAQPATTFHRVAQNCTPNCTGFHRIVTVVAERRSQVVDTTSTWSRWHSRG